MFHKLAPRTLARMVADAIRYYGDSPTEPASDLARLFFQQAIITGQTKKGKAEFLKMVELIATTTRPVVASPAMMLVAYDKLVNPSVTPCFISDEELLQSAVGFFNLDTLACLNRELYGSLPLLDVIVCHALALANPDEVEEAFARARG